MRHFFLIIRLSAVVLLLSACPRPAPSPDVTSEKSPIVFDGRIALRQAAALCAKGDTRSSGSPALQAAREQILAELQRLGWRTVKQTFTTSTPLGERTHSNVIATFPTETSATENWVFAATLDAVGSKENVFPAASEGAAGCGVLLELAQRLAAHPQQARQVTLLFLDGEAPVRQFAADDGLAGSRFYFQSLVENGQADQVRGAIFLGAVGHLEAKWVLPSLTSPDLRALLETQIASKGWEGRLIPATRPIWGAHLSAIPCGIPSLLLHDSSYQYLHTADDTASKLDEEALRKVGMILLGMLER